MSAPPRRRVTRWLASVAAAGLAFTGLLVISPTAGYAATALACDPHGPSAADAVMAARLNPLLNGKMAGHLNSYNMSCARVVVRAVRARHLSKRAAEIAVTTTIVESSIANLDSGDGSSVGLFQQTASSYPGINRNDPVVSTNAFLNEMLRVDPTTWPTKDLGTVCQDVQRSAYPARYDEQAHDGIAIADAMWLHVDGDFSGDGAADLLTETPTGDLRYFPNNAGSNPGGVLFTNYITTGTGFTGANRILEGDISGDGASDLLTTTPDGNLHYYPNNAGSNPGGVLFTNSIDTGSGWQNVNRMFLADISGDGADDLLATRTDGTLVYCPNNAGSNSDGRPFATCTTTGSGWQTATHMLVADFNGDGRADIVSETSDGQLRYFVNHGGNTPFSNYIVTGTGFDTATNLWAADFSGDGAADLLTETPTGDLHYFPNNGGSNPGGVLFTTYITTGTGFNTAARILPFDFSGDGAADLLTETTDGQLRYFPNNAGSNPGGVLFTNYITTGSGFTPDNPIITSSIGG